MRAIALLGFLPAACGGGDMYLSTEEPMKPETCMRCHADHYTQWSGSMHAFGSFCVQCHVTLAVSLGLTTDGTDLDTVPPYAKGVTCSFATRSIRSRAITTTRSCSRPTTRCAAASATRSRRPRTARPTPASSTVTTTARRRCAARATTSSRRRRPAFTSHVQRVAGHDLRRREQPAHAPHVRHLPHVRDRRRRDERPRRRDARRAAALGVHEHTFGGIDEALTDWPEKAGQQAAIGGKLCVPPNNGGQIEVTLDDRGPGHHWPSGAA